MAGPGGGPPRRSHTKSRNGCELCKKRHIRCDETFPQCRNCTKHKMCCPYNYAPVPESRSKSPTEPDLQWTPEIEAAIEQWQSTGQFPFPGLNVYPAPSPVDMKVEDLRLIYHIASISQQMLDIKAEGFTLWTHQIPTMLGIGATYDYVMHALLAFSATHLMYLTNCPRVGNIAYEHKGSALGGLHHAINTFSKETSDAVLAASIVLSWQATDWKSWTEHMQGTMGVVDAMDAWKDESLFGSFIAERSTFPTAPPSPSPDHRPSQPSEEDTLVLKQTIQQLQKLDNYLKQKREDTKPVTQLITFLKGSQKVTASLPIQQQFERLRPLRDWLFYLPVKFLQETRGSPIALAIIAHYYTVALLMERLFPEIGAAYFGSLTISPVEKIAYRLSELEGQALADPDASLNCRKLLQFPLEMVAEFRSRRGWIQPVGTPSYPQFSQPDLFMAHASPLVIPATTADYSPYANNLAFSYSTEDLSLVTPASDPSSALSPMPLSPFNNVQYLNIPSPSFATYSPASSNFGDFADFREASPILYNSDNEDSGPYGSPYGGPYSGPYDAASPIGGGATYGVGFVTSPVQPVWPSFPSTPIGTLAESPNGPFASPHPTLVPSPFLGPEQLSMLPLPESPVPVLVSMAQDNTEHITVNQDHEMGADGTS